MPRGMASRPWKYFTYAVVVTETTILFTRVKGSFNSTVAKMKPNISAKSSGYKWTTLGAYSVQRTAIWYMSPEKQIYVRRRRCPDSQIKLLIVKRTNCGEIGRSRVPVQGPIGSLGDRLVFIFGFVENVLGIQIHPIVSKITILLCHGKTMAYNTRGGSCLLLGPQVIVHIGIIMCNGSQ